MQQCLYQEQEINMANIENLQVAAQKILDTYKPKIEEYETLAQHYAELEAEGRDYLKRFYSENPSDLPEIDINGEECFSGYQKQSEDDEDLIETPPERRRTRPMPVVQTNAPSGGTPMNPSSMWSFSYPGPSNPSFMNMGMTQYPPNSPYMNYYGAPQSGNISAGLYSPMFPQQQNWLQGYPQQGWSFPEQGWGYPQQSWGSPQQGWGYPQQSWPGAYFSGQFSFH